MTVDPMTIEKVCRTCRFDCYTPGNYENPSESDCGRESEIKALCELWDLDDVDGWGYTEPCPLWESIPVSLCEKHGIFSADEFCVECLHPEIKDDTSGG